MALTSPSQVPGIPAWQAADLEKLSKAGELSGVNPLFLAIIAKEESEFDGGGINSSGFGGFFGLSVGQAGSGTLSSASQASFEDQAKLAAEDFSKALSAGKGNPVAAEGYYQSGKAGKATSGARLFAEYLGLAAPAGSTASTAAKTTAATSKGGIDLNPVDWISSIVGDVLSPFFRIFWGVAGAALIVIGLWLLVASEKSPKNLASALQGAGASGGAAKAAGGAAGVASSAEGVVGDAALVAA